MSPPAHRPCSGFGGPCPPPDQSLNSLGIAMTLAGVVALVGGNYLAFTAGRASVEQGP